MVEFVKWIESAEVQRVVAQTVLDQPPTHLLDHVKIVRPSRDDQIGDLEPHVFLVEDLQRSENRRQPSTVQLHIDIIIEALQIDVCCVKVLAERSKRFFVNVAVGFPDILDMFCSGELCRVVCVLIEGRRLGVCVGNRFAPAVEALFDKRDIK